MWNLFKRFGQRKQAEPQQPKPQDDSMPELTEGLSLEVLTIQGRLIFRGRITKVSDRAVQLVNADGEMIPYVPPTTQITLRGYSDQNAIDLLGMIGTINDRLWNVEQLKPHLSSERRAFFRQSISLTVQVKKIAQPAEGQEPEVLGKLVCRMLNISAGGTLMFSGGSLRVGDRIALKDVTLLEGEEPFSFTGLVRRAVPRGNINEFGCEFIDQSPEQQQRLIGVILKLQHQQMQLRREG